MKKKAEHNGPSTTPPVSECGCGEMQEVPAGEDSGNPSIPYVVLHARAKAADAEEPAAPAAPLPATGPERTERLPADGRHAGSGPLDPAKAPKLPADPNQNFTDAPEGGMTEEFGGELPAFDPFRHLVKPEPSPDGQRTQGRRPKM